MLPKELQENIVRRIVEAVHPVRIILFGSHAYGTPTEGSDIDLLVIEEKVVSKRKESVRIWELLSDLPFAKDIIVASWEEFDFYRKEAGSVFRTISEKGIEIYAR